MAANRTVRRGRAGGRDSRGHGLRRPAEPPDRRRAVRPRLGRRDGGGCRGLARPFGRLPRRALVAGPGPGGVGRRRLAALRPAAVAGNQSPVRLRRLSRFRGSLGRGRPAVHDRTGGRVAPEREPGLLPLSPTAAAVLRTALQAAEPAGRDLLGRLPRSPARIRPFGRSAFGRSGACCCWPSRR